MNATELNVQKTADNVYKTFVRNVEDLVAMTWWCVSIAESC